MNAYTLINLAAKAKPASKVAAKAALKAAGLKQTLADDLLNAQDKLRKLRLDKQTARANRRHINKPCGRKPITLPQGTPAARLLALRHKDVKRALGRMIDEHSHGQWIVNLTADPAAVGITTRSYYTGQKSGKWAIQATDTTITVPTDWRLRVQAKGLAHCDGLMTLDAAPMEAHGCELFAATWARRTGAKNVATDKGYIARADGVSYHGATADQALSGLAKKRRELALSIRLDAADLGDLVAKLASVRVSVGDARATGACEYGIRSWCAAVGLDFEAGSATLAEVYAAYQREPRPEARATLLRVLRRQRTAIAAI
jgi:hypothetical protein